MIIRKITLAGVFLALIVLALAAIADQCQNKLPFDKCPPLGGQCWCGQVRGEWSRVSEHERNFSLCNRKNPRCINYEPREGSCSELTQYRLAMSWVTCDTQGQDPPECQTKECLTRVIAGNVTGKDCLGRPCARADEIGN